MDFGESWELMPPTFMELQMAENYVKRTLMTAFLTGTPQRLFSYVVPYQYPTSRHTLMAHPDGSISVVSQVVEEDDRPQE